MELILPRLFQTCAMPFSINARFDNVDEELVAALAKAGLYLVYAGVESGNDHIRNTVMKRQMNEDSIHRAARLYAKYGVKVLTENVLGAPSETFPQALDTLKLNMRIRPAFANASIFSPYPKLEMTRFAIENGHFDGNFDRLNDNYYHSSVINFRSELEKAQILNLRCFFSLLSRHPWMMPILKPLLSLKPNPLFRFIGNLADGYYMKTCLPFKLPLSDFFLTLKHFLSFYRQGPSPDSHAEARNTVIIIGERASDPTGKLTSSRTFNSLLL